MIRDVATGPRVLVAGMGNDLCRDDGFGVVALRRLATNGTPDHLCLLEAGIGGIRLVHELMSGYDALIILDAVDRGGEPGTVYVLEVEIPQSGQEGGEPFRADMHLAVPSAVLTLAHALGALPPRVYIVGCQPQDLELGMGLSQPVERGVEEVLERLQGLIADLGRELPAPRAV